MSAAPIRSSTDEGSSPSWGRGVMATGVFGFVLLGLPDGMVGVAWPEVRQTFSEPLANLAELLGASLAGYLMVTMLTGWGLRRHPPATLLIGCAATATVGASLLATSRWWVGVVVAAGLLGSAGGGLDAILNTLVALTQRRRLMNLIHASYGIGFALGPLAVTAALVWASGWRLAYGMLAVLELTLVGAWIWSRSRLGGPLAPEAGSTATGDAGSTATGDAGSTAPGDAGSTAAGDVACHGDAPRPDGSIPREGVWRRWLLPLSLGSFFATAALEGTVAAWAASYLRGPAGLSVTWAGLAVFLFGAGMTLGRMLAAWRSLRWTPQSIAGVGVVVTTGCAALVWADAGPVATVLALVGLGCGLGPVFPALMTLTPARLGHDASVHAVGWQVAAAGMGGIGVASLVGLVLQATGLQRLGPILVLLACWLGLMVFATERTARQVSEVHAT